MPESTPPTPTPEPIPAPGSDAALNLGCTCPVLSNAHGQRSDGRFTMNWGCPIHHQSAVNLLQFLQEQEP